MKKWILLGALAFVVVLGAACTAESLKSSSAETGNSSSGGVSSGTQPPSSAGQSGSAQPAVVTKISAQVAKEKMDAGNVVVLDVRTESEYTEKHIPGARLLTNETITDAPVDLPKDAVLLVYCRSGRRSAEAAQKLADLGYRNVYDFGGIIDWPYETESGAPQQ